MLIWYLARAAGVTAFGLLSIATAAGVITSRPAKSPSQRVITQYLHRSTALAGLAMLVLHIVTVLGDTYAKVSLTSVFVPMTAGYRPVAVSLGVLALWAFVLVGLTGALRARFTVSDKAVRSWRKIHLLSYLAWFASAWHFWFTGTDTGQWWARAVLFLGVAGVLAAVVTRLSEEPERKPATGRPPARIGGRV